MASGKSLPETKFEKVEAQTKEVRKQRAVIRQVNTSAQPQDDGPSTPKAKQIFSIAKDGEKESQAGTGPSGTENKNKYDTRIKGWIPIECNAEIFTNFAIDLGFQTLYSFTEVGSLEPDMNGIIPQPSLAMILCYEVQDSAYDLVRLVDYPQGKEQEQSV